MDYFKNILPSVIEALYLMIVGMTIVFLVLIFFSFVIWLLQKLDYYLSKTPRPTYTAEDIVIENAKLSRDDYRELIAVIAAAISVNYKNKFVIKKVKYISQKPKSWVTSGRSTLLSHNIVKRK